MRVLAFSHDSHVVQQIDTETPFGSPYNMWCGSAQRHTLLVRRPKPFVPPPISGTDSSTGIVFHCHTDSVESPEQVESMLLALQLPV